eukprot:scaffold2911_cov414-Prasinococcus_capsulatus_cf.AAC.21
MSGRYPLGGQAVAQEPDTLPLCCWGRAGQGVASALNRARASRPTEAETALWAAWRGAATATVPPR